MTEQIPTQTGPIEEEETHTVVIHPGSPVEIVAVTFFREDVANECVATKETCAAIPTWVNRENADLAVCRSHRMEMPPRERRDYIKIEDVPSKKLTLGEMLFGDEEPDEEEFSLMIHGDPDTADTE